MSRSVAPKGAEEDKKGQEWAQRRGNGLATRADEGAGTVGRDCIPRLDRCDASASGGGRGRAVHGCYATIALDLKRGAGEIDLRTCIETAVSFIRPPLTRCLTIQGIVAAVDK